MMQGLDQSRIVASSLPPCAASWAALASIFLRRFGTISGKISQDDLRLEYCGRYQTYEAGA